jgi:asparaginyl-tRNA synthetase
MAEASTKSTVYVDEQAGQDETAAAGTQTLPFRTLQYAYIRTEGKAEYLVRKAPEAAAEGSVADAVAAGEWKAAAKSAVKKAENALKTFQKKASKEKELEEKRLKEDEARQAVLEEAKKVAIVEDKTLPAPKKIRLDHTEGVILHKTGSEQKGTRIVVLGRVLNVRKQKDIFFVELRDGYGKMQCLLQGNLSKTYDAITLTRETSMELRGELWEVPPGAKAPLNRELHVDYFHIPKEWKAPGGDDAITNRIAKDTEASILLDLRHLTLRGENASAVMLVRDELEWAFHSVYREMSFRKVSPPAIGMFKSNFGSLY